MEFRFILSSGQEVFVFALYGIKYGIMYLYLTAHCHFQSLFYGAILFYLINLLFCPLKLQCVLLSSVFSLNVFEEKQS